MLVSFVYVLGCRVLEFVVLLIRGERSKEPEIVVLRYQLSILRRQAGRPQLAPRDRLVLAAIELRAAAPLLACVLRHAGELLRWHRRLVSRRWAYPHRQPGRPPVNRIVRELILRLARENSHWGYVRIAGELRKLGITVSATLVRNVLGRAGVPPAPQRAQLSWRAFLRQHAATTLACDFFTVDTVRLQRLYVLFFISIGTRRLEHVACTSNPDTAWMTQQARNLLMELEDRQHRPLFLIHDRDKKFSRAFDGIFQSEAITIIRTPFQAPNANAYAERWVGSVRRECLDRLLIFSRRQLERVLHVYVRHYNQHRPHRALELRSPNANVGAAPPRPAMLGVLQVQRRDLLGGLLHEYEAAA